MIFTWNQFSQISAFWKTETERMLLTDISIVHFYQNGIRGRIIRTIKNYAELY